MKVYLNDEKKSVDPWLLYDILLGLKSLCGSVHMALFFIKLSEIKLPLNYRLKTFPIYTYEYKQYEICLLGTQK